MRRHHNDISPQEVRSSSPETSDALIAAFVTMAKRALEPPVVNLSDVYPALRHHEFLDGVETAADDPLIGEGPGDLISVVLADVGDGLATLTQEAADRSRLQPAQILTAAEENFVKLLPHEVVSCEPAAGVVSIGLENHPWLGTSLLFVPSLLSQVMSDRGWGRALVAAPTRESVDLVRADRANAVDVMQGWMQMRLSGPRSLSEVVLTMEQGDENLTKSHVMADQRLMGLN
jgi:hypothetical protein